MLERGQRVSAIGTTRFGQPTTAPGTMRRVAGGVLAAEFDFDVGSAGGPVFAADGTVVGLTSVKGDSSDTSIGEDNTGLVSVSARVRHAGNGAGEDDRGCAAHRARSSRWNRCRS